MKILYTVQKTGNGHLARAEEIIPILKKYAEVDILASGKQSEIILNHDVKYDLPGISLFYSDKGGLSFKKIIAKNNFRRFFQDIFKIPVKDYDLIINDFEPVTAWASKFSCAKIVSLSHQSALLFSGVPKPKQGIFFLRLFLRLYAPVKKFYGFHFQNYHKNIFTPVIREKIRALVPYTSDKVVVYLPSFSDEVLYGLFKNLSGKFKIFSKNVSTDYIKGNCSFFKINEEIFFQHLESCKAVLCNAGFELPAEALYLKKKLFVIPIKYQAEQYCNAAALAKMGVKTSMNLTKESIEEWLSDAEIPNYDFPDITEQIVRQVIAENIPQYYRNYQPGNSEVKKSNLRTAKP